jgi:hypothetical protein
MTDDAGTRYPFINLKKAIDRANQLFAADQKGREMSVSSAFEIWQYSAKSSGGFQTVGALKMYGLVKAPNAGKICLTENALRYFRHEEEAEKTKLLGQFALSPKLIAALWKDWHTTPPADTLARSHLKADRHLNDQGARTLLTIYKENISFADLKGDAILPPSISDDGDDDPTPTIKIGDYIQWSPGGVNQFKPVRKVEWISDDGNHLRVFGSLTGIPVSEATVEAAPATAASAPPPLFVPASTQMNTHGTKQENPINAYLVGNRVQIAADVDAEGLKKLQSILDKYSEILQMLQEPVRDLVENKPSGPERVRE